MTLSEFEMHRPKLADGLKVYLNEEYFVVDIAPEYSSQILFRAEVKARDEWGISSYLVCVSPQHPLAFVEEEGPGVPTWWWQSDLI